MKTGTILIAAATAAVIGIGAYFMSAGKGRQAGMDGGAEATKLVEVTVPELSERGRMGEQAFNAKCAACHGPDAAGNDGMGPPLVHKIYESGHHGDMAFMMAPRQGVRAHHWRFGDMPPVKGVTDADLASIIVYIRELQRANGIF